MPATLHIDTGREMRGGQWQVLYLLRGLSAAGHRATLLARKDSPLLEHARSDGLDARPFQIVDWLRLAPSFDLVHAHTARAHALAALSPHPALIVSRRVAFPIRTSIVSRRKYARARHYIAVSAYVERILEQAGVPRTKIDIVHDGVFLPPIANVTNGQDVLALDSDDPGKGKAMIGEAARLAGVNVVFSKDLPSALMSARLFVYITECEGLGSAALLAMAAGVPVLASAVGGLPEIVTDGFTGALTLNSPEQIADTMLRLLRDPEQLVELGRNGRTRVEKSFTTEEMMRNTLAVYRKVLA